MRRVEMAWAEQQLLDSNRRESLRRSAAAYRRPLLLVSVANSGAAGEDWSVTYASSTAASLLGAPGPSNCRCHAFQTDTCSSDSCKPLLHHEVL